MPPTPDSIKPVKHEKKLVSPTVKNKPLISAKTLDTPKIPTQDIKTSASSKTDRLARRMSSRQDLNVMPTKDVTKPSKDTIAKLREKSPKKRKNRSRLRSKKTSTTPSRLQSSPAIQESGSETESIKKTVPKSERRSIEEKPRRYLSSSEFDSQASYNDSGSDAISVAESKITKYSLDNNTMMDSVQNSKAVKPNSAITKGDMSVERPQLSIHQSLPEEDFVSPELDAQSRQPDTEELDDVSPRAVIEEELDEKSVTKDSDNKEVTSNKDDLISLAGTPTTPIDDIQGHSQNAETDISVTTDNKPNDVPTFTEPLAASQDADGSLTSPTIRNNDPARKTGCSPASIDLHAPPTCGDETDTASNPETSSYRSSNEAERSLHSNIVLCSPSSEPAIPVTKPTKSFKKMLAKKRAKKAAMAASLVSGSDIASENLSPTVSTKTVSRTTSPMRAESSYFREVDFSNAASDATSKTIQDTKVTTQSEKADDNDKTVSPSTASQEDLPTVSDFISNMPAPDPSEADISELDVLIDETNRATKRDRSMISGAPSETNLLSYIDFPISPTTFTAQTPTTILRKYTDLAQGLVGCKVSGAGAIIDNQDRIMGRATGDLPSMYGMPISENGGVFSMSGQLAGYVTENYTIASPVPDEKDTNNTEDLVADKQVREIIARVGVDKSGNLVDDSGRVVGKVAGDFSTGNFTPTSTSSSSPAEESSTEPNSAEKEGTADASPPKIQLTAAKEDEGNPDVYLDVKSTRDGIQISIRIPSGFMKPQETASK